jgi:hypothetical protein
MVNKTEEVSEMSKAIRLYEFNEVDTDYSEETYVILTADNEDTVWEVPLKDILEQQTGTYHAITNSDDVITLTTTEYRQMLIDYKCNWYTTEWVKDKVSPVFDVILDKVQGKVEDMVKDTTSPEGLEAEVANFLLKLRTLSNTQL